jgi:hypothetical protein
LAAKKRQVTEEAAAAVAKEGDLQLCILSLPPLMSAIRMGALSTWWRALWEHHWPAPSSLDLHLRSGVDDPDQLLGSLHRRGRRPLDRFSLTFYFGEYHRRRLPHRYFSDEDICYCLDYVAACNTEDLHLDITNKYGNGAPIPDSPRGILLLEDRDGTNLFPTGISSVEFLSPSGMAGTGMVT